MGDGFWSEGNSQAKTRKSTGGSQEENRADLPQAEYTKCCRVQNFSPVQAQRASCVTDYSLDQNPNIWLLEDKDQSVTQFLAQSLAQGNTSV